MPTKGALCQGLSQDSSKAGADHEAHIIIERGSGIKSINAAIACDVAQVVVVPDIAGGITPGYNRIALAIKAGLRAERGVFAKLL